MKNRMILQQIEQGFTLIELLVVIAVVGVLAGALLVVINPTQKLNSARDAGVASGIDQIGSALQAYYGESANLGNPTYPVGNTNAALMTIVTNGDLKQMPNTATGNTWQYAGNANGAWVTGLTYDQSGAVSPNTNYWCWDTVKGAKLEKNQAQPSILCP